MKSLLEELRGTEITPRRPRDVDVAPTLRRKTYLVLDEESCAVKIGNSFRPWDRVAAFQPGNPHKLRLIGVCDALIERDLHRLFSEARLQGEWFDASHPLVAAFLASKEVEIAYELGKRRHYFVSEGDTTR
jgi:hypothetical protein